MTKASDKAVVESFKRAMSIYYQRGKGSIKGLARKISLLKMAARENQPELLEIYKEDLAGLTVDALLDDDWEFIELLLAASKSGTELSSVPEWEECVFVVFQALYKPGRKLEKLEVQQFAKRFRVINAQKIKGANPFSFGTESVEREIQKAIKALREPVWTRIYERCGLADLQKNIGGRKPAKPLQKPKKTINRKHSPGVDGLKS